MEKTKRTPLNNLDLKREEKLCTTDYLPSYGFEKGTRPRSSMEFASTDDDEDIYDSEHI